MTTFITADTRRRADPWRAVALFVALMPLAWWWNMPGWVFMWTQAGALVLAGKLWRWGALLKSQPRLPVRAWWYWCWPGMAITPFSQAVDGPPPRFHAWLAATAKIVLGAVLIGVVVPMIAPTWTLARAWTAMAGLILIAHCGLFHLATLLLNQRGIPVRSLMRAPLLAESVADFWSERWNRAFRDLAQPLVFAPLRRRWRVGLASAGVFMASGLVHEWVISLPARGGFGGPTLYFLLQSMALACERRCPFLVRGWWRRTWTLTVVAAPAPLLFHRAFAERVMLPFLTALGVV